MAGIESSKDMTKNIDAILKDVYQKELLDYSNVKELEGMRNNPKFDWVDKKSIDDRITEIKAIETAQTTADKENFKRDEERFKVLKEDTFSSLALRALSGENISGDRDVLLSFTQDILAAFKNNLITWEQLGTLRNPEKAVPYGREDATEVRKIAMRLLPQFSEGDRELGTLNYDIATAKDPLKKKKLTVQRDAYMETLREQSFQVAKSMVGINKTSKLIPELEKIGIKPNDARQMLQALTVGRPKGQTPLEEGIMLKRKISTAKGVTPEKQNPELTGPGVPSEKVDEIELDHKLNQSDKQATADDGDLDGSRHDLGGDKNALEAQDIKEQKAKMEGVNAQFPEKEGEEIGGETPPATEEQRATIQEVQGQELPDESSAFAIPDDDESGDTLAEEAQTSQVKETRKPITIEELAAQEYPYVPDIAPNWTKDEIEYEKKLDKEAKIEFIKGQLEKSPNAYPEYIITENGKPLNLVQQKDVLPPKDIPNRSYALAKEYSAVDVDTDKLIYNKSVVKGETVGSYVDLIVKAAKSQSARDLVPDFVALMEQESKFNNGAKSWTNVKGLVQMTQGLASDLGLSREDITTPEKVIPAGFKHFKRLLGTFKSKEWTHIGWNAGWGVAEKLKRYGIDPGNWETTKGKLEQALRAFPKTYGPDKIPVKKKLKEVIKHVETIIRRTEEIKKAKAKE